jgi:hypothetical protein
MNRAACTIVSPNYAAYAQTLAASYLAQHPGQRFFVLIVAACSDPAPFIGRGFEPVLLNQIGLADLRAEAMKYDILELNTNVKPTFMRWLIERHDLDQLVYLDPDIFCYAPLTPVFAALDAGANATLTPHMTVPVFDGKSPSEQDLLYNGTYNLGFIAVRRSQEADRLLRWWEHRCLAAGFSEGRTGLFVDQKWMNHAPGLFDGVAILRHPGLNMAYWNLHERTLVADNGALLVSSPVQSPVPLCFFHFSGIRLDDPQSLSAHTNRTTLAQRPDLRDVFRAYKQTVLANRDPQLHAMPYGFDTFSDGTAITRLARRLFAAHQQRFTADPFDARGAFAQWAMKTGLVKGPKVEKKQSWSDFNPRDRRVEAVHHLLRLALRVLGPHRYELLMRYLAHISVLRHQSVIFRDPTWPAESRDTHDQRS